MKIVVGVSGASGTAYALRLLEKLNQCPGTEVHLVLSRAAEKTAFLETGKTAADFRLLCRFFYSNEDIGCRLASGSFPTDAMVVVPCSIHTLSSIAHGISSNLIVRAADVTLKERRKLLLAVRESPLHLGHLRAMATAAELGAIICPPVPGFYHRPKTVEEIVEHSVDRMLDLLGLPQAGAVRWDPRRGSQPSEPAG